MLRDDHKPYKLVLVVVKERKASLLGVKQAIIWDWERECTNFIVLMELCGLIH